MRKHLAVAVLALGAVVTVGGTIAASEPDPIPSAAFESPVPTETPTPTPEPSSFHEPLPPGMEMPEPIPAETTPADCPDGLLTDTQGFCFRPEPAPAPVTPELVEVELVELDVIEEDEPGWDCRVMGNTRCGVLIVDQWYIVDFVNGQPVAVAPRGF